MLVLVLVLGVMVIVISDVLVVVAVVWGVVVIMGLVVTVLGVVEKDMEISVYVDCAVSFKSFKAYTRIF